MRETEIHYRKLKKNTTKFDLGVPLEIKSTSPSSFPQRRLILHYDCQNRLQVHGDSMLQNTAEKNHSCCPYFSAGRKCYVV
ncbi:hypothetical protein CsatB_016716 [Cannabis sativa]